MNELPPDINPQLFKHHEPKNQEVNAKGRPGKPKIEGRVNPGAERVSNLAKAVVGQIGPRGKAGGVKKRVANNPPLKTQIEQGVEKIRNEFGVDGEKVSGRVLETLKTHKRMERPQLMTVANFSAYLTKHKFDPPSWLMGLAPEESIAIVWRGCGMESLIRMIANESASRDEKYDLNVAAPSEEAAKMQVAEHVGDEHLPEFTHMPQKASQFGRGSLVAAFAVPVKYLTPGSVSEGGVVCAKSAPASLIGWEEGKPLDNINLNVRNKMRFQ